VPFRLPDRSTRVRIAMAAGALGLVFAAFGACGACRARPSDTTANAAASAGADGGVASPSVLVDAASLRDPLLWGVAKEGDAEDLASLAAHEGAAGLVEAASEPALRPTAIRAMGFARGWAQLPFLGKAAGGKDDDEARLALDATFELAARPRRAEDPEDAEELREGCESLLALARDTERARARRIGAVRALRMMPCPRSKEGGEVPTDLDAK
jgi:hypothetical protein